MVDQARGDLPHDDLVRSGGRLELRRDPDRLSGHEALACVRRRGDDLPRLDPDPDLERDSVLLQELLVERGDPGLDVERGARRAERVVLVRDRDPERGHDRVARVLLDRASVAHDRRRHGLEVALQDGAERFRVESRRKRHGLDDVGEQHRDETPKLHRRPGERCLLEEQRVVLAENGGLELPQLGPWVDPEFLDQRPASGAIGGEGVGLPTRAVEREHELPAGALA